MVYENIDFIFVYLVAIILTQKRFCQYLKTKQLDVDIILSLIDYHSHTVLVIFLDKIITLRKIIFFVIK